MGKREWFYLAWGFTMFFGFALIVSPVADAVETEVHGYGFQGFLMSNKNNYFGAEEGTWNFSEVAVLFNSKVDDKTSIWIQLFGESGEGGASEFGIDWAFVNYHITPELDGRIGQAKFPVGIYNEIRDNKILHLTLLEPTMYQTDFDVIFEAYRGVGFTYNIGPLSVDVYGGQPVIEPEDPNIELELKNLGGGRIIYNTPLKGLRLMASYAAFSEEQFNTNTGEALPEGHEKLAVGSIDYVNGEFDLKAEYARKEGIDEDLVSSYAEVGYTFHESLTPYIRYDYLLNDEDGCDDSDPACYQKDITVGVGYKFNPYFGIKVENHWMDGFLGPLSRGDVAATAEKKWNLFAAGMNFMF